MTDTGTRTRATAVEAIDSVPIVDVAPFLEGSARGKRSVAQAIKAAAESVGFMYLKGHGVDAAVVSAAFEASRRFFALPLEEKLRLKVNASHRGYIPMNNSKMAEGLKPNANESFLAGLDLGPDDPDVKAGTPLHGPNQWPADLVGFKESVETYQRELTGLCTRLLPMFALALDLEENFFAPYFSKPMPFVRLLHYPPQRPDRDDTEFGIAPHTDYGFVTVLAQDDVGGLQVKRRDGGWIDVPRIPGTFVVNIADMLMRWTNDRWVSNPHRVINTSGRERYSLPFFFDPTYHAEVACISSCEDSGHPPKYEPVVWGEYLRQRFDSAYAYRKETK